MIVEIMSPSTAKRDMALKFNVYLQAGVREYWVVDPETYTVSVHVLENGKYVTSVYGEDGIAPVRVLGGFGITLSDVFADSLF